MQPKFRITAALASITALSLSLTVPAHAQFQDGVFISGGISSTTQELNQSRNTGSNQPNVGPAQGPSGTVVDKDSDFGFFAGIGYKKQITPDFFGAVEGFYSTEDASTTTINNFLVNQTDLEATYGADLRLGTNVTDKVAIYGLVGLTGFDLDSRISYTFAPPVDNVSNEEWAFVYGGGVEIGLSDRISTFGEFRLANDIAFETPVDRGNVRSVNELNYSVVRTGLRFSF